MLYNISILKLKFWLLGKSKELKPIPLTAIKYCYLNIIWVRGSCKNSSYRWIYEIFLDIIAKWHTTLLISRFERILALSFMFSVIRIVFLSDYVRYGSKLVNDVRFVYNLTRYRRFSSVFSLAVVFIDILYKQAYLYYSVRTICCPDFNTFVYT